MLEVASARATVADTEMHGLKTVSPSLPGDARAGRTSGGMRSKKRRGSNAAWNAAESTYPFCLMRCRSSLCCWRPPARFIDVENQDVRARWPDMGSWQVMTVEPAD
ncbi:unnamed protein product [Prorocentrum cordatum]|uniref:Uncharacterized protein n=1 Tax=Prorocentrum cordatum TaxID=2364126 RepID=A0ABN9QDZ8_9DINO|nr:unnamed protein product [Polarella glacialis]